MKSFTEICKMTQPQVKEYMKEYLKSKSYNVVDEDGFLYAKGDVPVLIVAHMDTVHQEQCKTIYIGDNKISSPEGIGGDDRCGVFIIMNIVRELKCSVLLCEDEEKGGQGAKKFVKATYKDVDDGNNTIDVNYIDTLDVNYMIEFDRKGNNDAVFYSCDNKDFTDFVLDCTGFKFATGTYSDISTLMPASHIAAVNLSSGYYNAHTKNEYVVYEEMIDTIDAALNLITSECDGPFEYIEKKYNFNYINTNNSANARDFERDWYYEDLFDRASRKEDKFYKFAKEDKKLELEVVITNYIDNNEDILYAEGNTIAECWMNIFFDNPHLCAEQIVDYSWS